MTELISEVLELLGQLIEIGSEYPEVLIATMVLIAGAGLTCVLFCISVVIAIPFVTLRGLFGLIKWIYYRKHPEYLYALYEDEEEEPSRPERKSKAKQSRSKVADTTEELDPVLPHWVNQKGGRLL